MPRPSHSHTYRVLTLIEGAAPVWSTVTATGSLEARLTAIAMAKQACGLFAPASIRVLKVLRGSDHAKIVRQNADLYQSYIV